MRRILYSLWLLPLVVPMLYTILMIVTLAVFWNSLTVFFGNLVLGILIPISYLLGWITSREREDRRAFLTVSAVHLASATLLMLYMYTDYWLPLAGVVPVILSVLSSVAVVAATVIAFLRRKRVIERAVLHRARRSSADGSPTKAAASVSQPALNGSLNTAIGATRQNRPQQERQVAVPAPAPVPQAPAPVPQAPAPIQPAPAPVPAAARPMPSRQAPTAAPTNAAAATLSLDANSCSTTELLALPNMNASAARAIVSEREAHGPYQSIEELIARNDLKPHVVVSFISHLYVVVPPTMPGTPQRVRRLDL